MREPCRFWPMIAACFAMAFAASAEGPDKNIPEPRRIALSFDDAPNGNGPLMTGEERAAALMAALASENVPQVVFFVRTDGIDSDARRQRIQDYAEAGHLIANHSHSHEWLSQTDVEAYINDIDRAETELAGFPNRRPWFRFPYLDEGTPVDKRDAVRAALAERGLMNGYVTVDSYDWHVNQAVWSALGAGSEIDFDALGEAYVDMLVGAVRHYESMAIEFLGRSPAHVLLLHENDLAAMFVDDLVRALRFEGFEIISPDEAYSDPVSQVVPRTLMTNQGHVAALAVEAGRDTATLGHPAISTSAIDELLAARKVFTPELSVKALPE